jgi:hypothetical protein
MKFYFLCFLLFSCLTISAQDITYNILGKIRTPGDYKYVYLHMFDVDDASISLRCVPIVRNEFSFAGTVDLKHRLSINAAIFLGMSSSLTYDSIRRVEKELGYIRMCRFVALEDLTIDIQNPGDISRAKVTGGLLNREKDEVTELTSDGKFNEFLDTRLDSPASLTLLSSLTHLAEFLKLDKVYFLRKFEAFSLRLRTSPEAKKLLEKIDSIE